MHWSEDALSSDPLANSLSLLPTRCLFVPQVFHPSGSSTFLQRLLSPRLLDPSSLCAASLHSLLCLTSLPPLLPLLLKVLLEEELKPCHDFLQPNPQQACLPSQQQGEVLAGAHGDTVPRPPGGQRGWASRCRPAPAALPLPGRRPLPVPQLLSTQRLWKDYLAATYHMTLFLELHFNWESLTSMTYGLLKLAAEKWAEEVMEKNHKRGHSMLCTISGLFFQSSGFLDGGKYFPATQAWPHWACI